MGSVIVTAMHGVEEQQMMKVTAGAAVRRGVCCRGCVAAHSAAVGQADGVASAHAGDGPSRLGEGEPQAVGPVAGSTLHDGSVAVPYHTCPPPSAPAAYVPRSTAGSASAAIAAASAVLVQVGGRAAPCCPIALSADDGSAQAESTAPTAAELIWKAFALQTAAVASS